MRKRGILLYLTGIILFLAGNRNLWDELRDLERRKEELKKQARINDNIENRFEVQTLKYDSISKKIKNPEFYFQIIELGDVNFRAGKKAVTRVERDDDENATESH